MKLLPTLLMIYIGLVYIPSISFALGNDPNNSNNTPDTGVMVGQIFKVIVVLIIIIGLIIILIKFLSQKNKQWLSTRSIRQLGGITLGQNKSLQIIEIGHSIYVLGVADNIHLIHRIDEQGEVEYIIDALSSNKQKGANLQFLSVSQWIKGLFTAKKDIVDEDEEMTSSFHEVFQNKMSSITSRKASVEELLRDQTTKERSNNKQ